MKKLAFALSLLVALSLSGCGLLARQRTTATASPTPSAIASPTPAATAGPAFTRQEALDYFAEIAFGSEYGDEEATVAKWASPIKATVLGEPTEEDRKAVTRVMDGLNAVEGFPGMNLLEAGREDRNMEIWFVPLDRMAAAVPGYVEGNWGFFTVNLDSDSIQSATVAIATDVTKQRERNHLIFEEIIQAMGLMQDAGRYHDSIFYGPWTTVQKPTVLDWELVRMLYLPQIKEGMVRNEALSVLADTYIPRN